MRVFILQQSNMYTVNSAKTYGKITYLFDKDEKLSSFNLDETIGQIQARLAKYNFHPDDDTIALTGSIVPVSLLLSILTHNYDTVKVLVFDSVKRRYRLVAVNVVCGY